MTETPYDIFGIECGVGWEPLVAPIIKRCEAEDAVIFQIKEKFGRLRIYLNDDSEELSCMAAEAERRSAEICELCGKPGTLRLRDGWFSTRCEECAGPVRG